MLTSTISKQTTKLRNGLDELGILWWDQSTYTPSIHHEITKFKDKIGYTNSAIFCVIKTPSGYMHQASYGGPDDLEFWPHYEASTGDPYPTSTEDILKYAKENCK